MYGGVDLKLDVTLKAEVHIDKQVMEELDLTPETIQTMEDYQVIEDEAYKVVTSVVKVKESGAASDVPKGLAAFMYGVMKEARCSDFTEFLENWELTMTDFAEIEDWFQRKAEIKL